MHVLADLNLNWFVQLIITTLVVCLGFGLHSLVKKTASKYFVFEDPTNNYIKEKKRGVDMANEAAQPCAVCGNYTKKRCSRCKMISYCSEACQRSHWISDHKAKCNNLKLISKANSNHSASTWQERKASSAVSPSAKTSDIVHHSGKILFPYDEFVELFDWKSPGFPPCGLLNCGNSCFTNVVLQCLAYTKPLVAYLLVKGHRRECRRNDWCFLCEFQTHLERASHSSHPFSPINILSRLPNIGGNLSHGSQEDAHEFMRFAIDTMQSVCLDQFGGEKAVHPRSQQTTLIQHIFGGQLQSQVICTKCNNISNQLENMMDLTVEIQGDAASLEECLDQFTAKEQLHGENMYKCDSCNEYVTAWKRLSVRLPPNILTIALKRFQSGRFGKLNKRVTFPETLDLSPYMSKVGGADDIYKLYAVIVHVDMLNASFFGHYVCYLKDFLGQWYRIDDCKVARVELDEVLSQGAYMLLYSRARARPSMYDLESIEPELNNYIEHNEESRSSIEQSAAECTSVVSEDLDTVGDSDSSAVTMTFPDGRACSSNSSEDVMDNMDKVDPGARPFVKNDVGILLSSGDASLSCKYIEEDDVADTIPISDVEGDKSEGSMKDTSFAIATGKAETTSDKPGNLEHLTPSRATLEIARKCNGIGNSDLKLKPLFSPGFLGKQQQKKCIKKTVVSSDKQQKPASSAVCCISSNRFSEPTVHCQDHSFTDDENQYGCPERPEVSSNNVIEDTDMVDVDFTRQEAGGDSVSLKSPRINDIKMLDTEVLIKDKPDPW
ncbi:hypothetical protein Leryth_005270 [Lithospermum erythrorhizon]|nr:hypothetical protein Leryth_005270 [Lithospermum erythrorhizon]